MQPFRIKIYSILFLFLANVLIGTAQETEFERLKQTLSLQSLPLVNITVDLTLVNTKTHIPAHIEICDYYKRTNPDSISTTYNCEIKYRGASATRYNKKSFAVKLTTQAGQDLNANLFGIRKDNSWILDAMAIDRLRMRNRVCFDIWNAMSKVPYNTPYDRRNGTAGFFVEVFINGNYHGLYCLTDKIDRKLLALNKYSTNSKGETTIRGVLYKGISWGSATYLTGYTEATTDTRNWNTWELQYPEDLPSYETWHPLIELLDFCTKEKTSIFRSQYTDHFYPENLIEYAVFTMALNVGDNAYKNTFLSNVDIQKQATILITPWDMDMSLGGNWNGNYNEKTASIYRYDKIGPFNKLLPNNIDHLRNRMADYWNDNKHNYLSTDNVAQRIIEYAELFTLSGAWEREVAKWNNNPVPLKTDLFEEVDYVVNWYKQNYAAVDAQFMPLSTPIPTTTVSPTTPTIYTLDGKALTTPINRLQKGIYIINGTKVRF